MPHSNLCGAESHRSDETTVPQPPTSIAQAIALLQTTWATLHFIERGYAVESLLKSGVSRRYLARELNCPESTLRCYGLALQAGATDIAMARRGAISLRGLVRGVTGRFLSSDARRTCDADTGAAAIVDWLDADPARKLSARKIIQEVILELGIAAQTGDLSSVPVSAPMDLPVMIERCRPNQKDFELDIAWYARWMTIWVFHLIRAANVREQALNKALEQFPQCRGKAKI